MINQPTTYAPVMQQTIPAQAPEFNAIKINITGATVGAPATPAPVITQQPVVQQETVGQNVNYTA